MSKPELFKKRVDSSKVNMLVLRRWVETELYRHLPNDDIAVGLVCELLLEKSPDIDAIHEQLQDMLGKKESLRFCVALWEHMLSAQEDEDGLPEKLVNERQKLLRSAIQREKQVLKKRSDKFKVRKPRTNYNRG